MQLLFQMAEIVDIMKRTLYILILIVVSDFEVRCGCLFCWFWWNCWPSCIRRSLHNHISHRIVEYKKGYLPKHI